MNLDLDDPLGDLLSDGSNDSLFGMEPAKKAAPKVERKDERQPKASKKMEQLFGISEEQKPVAPKQQPPQQQQKLQAPPATKPAHENFDTKSNDSLSSDLGFDPKKLKKKSNILDELLGISELPAAKAQLPSKAPPPAATARAPISRQTTSETVSENPGENPPARKSGRRQSAVMFNDPLGLFAASDKEQLKKAKAARKSVAGTEWLFADGNPAPLTKLKSSPAIQITANSEERNDEEPGSSNVTSLESKNTLPMKSQATVVMESLVSETANTINTMKQQEFQLMVASQMKTQESVLIEMKNKQQELLKQQEHQFNELLRKQIARQSELEEIIKNQQERINSHIQALMASHAHAPFIETTSFVGEKTAAAAANPLEKIELEGDVKRLEMEKLRLEDLLSNISDNHEKEVVMIERSYKKRLELMEQNLEATERRYRSETTALEQFHGDKVKSISEERASVIGSFEAKIRMMEESHQNFIDRLRQSYESDLEMLRRHYEEMMQNIRKSKFMEFAIGEESSVHADMLKRASSNLESATGDISQLHEVLQEKLAVLERDREVLLSSREKKLEGMRENVC
jgi:Fas-binding factor 1